MATTVTAATLKARWREFIPTLDAVVTAAIAEALPEVDANVYGDSYDHAVMLLACHKLACGAFGQDARAEAKAGDDDLERTSYGSLLRGLQQKRGGGFWVVGMGATGGPLR